MARKPRIEKIGFYHILNRGVAKSNVYLCDEDFERFLEIVQEASEEYGFEIFSYCLMNNHYHLLLKTSDENLSMLMQKINSRYSIYFNQKYNGVGPLWQGRFKSWYVYDEHYLHTLVKYIEYNPIKASITSKIGSYRWAMSSRYDTGFSMLNYQLIESIDLKKEFDENDQKRLSEFLNRQIAIQNDKIIQKEKKPLAEFFHHYSREEAIFKAVQEGYTQKEIAEFLSLSQVAVSKILKIYRQKLKLFAKLKEKGIFWSYSKAIEYDEDLLIEYTLKYADFDDTVLLIKFFGKRKTKAIWEKTMMDDKRFIKLNVMLARAFFDMDIEAAFLKQDGKCKIQKN